MAAERQRERINTKPGGYTNRRVGKGIMRHSVSTAELGYVIIDDITDNDGDNTRALKAINEILRRNVHLFDVGAGLADSDLMGAEASSKRMTGEDGDKGACEAELRQPEPLVRARS